MFVCNHSESGDNRTDWVAWRVSGIEHGCVVFVELGKSRSQLALGRHQLLLLYNRVFERSGLEPQYMRYE